MTRLYNEVKSLEMGDAIDILNRVQYKDLQREYKLLADMKHDELEVRLERLERIIIAQNSQPTVTVVAATDISMDDSVKIVKKRRGRKPKDKDEDSK